MKNVDKFLVVIVIGVVALVVLAFAVALRQPEPTYRTDDTPEGVVNNYILALRDEDYERAWGYLSPTLEGYPPSVEQFVDDTFVNRWEFSLDSQGRALEVDSAQVTGDRAIVEVLESSFQQDGLFASNQLTNRFDMELALEDGTWRLIAGERYWHDCWDRPETCDPIRLPPPPQAEAYP